MDSENQESTPEATEAPASTPRKRAPRRVVSTDLPEKDADVAAESKPAASKSAKNTENTEGGAEEPTTERPRRRRPAADKSESAAESDSSE